MKFITNQKSNGMPNKYYLFQFHHIKALLHLELYTKYK